VKNALLHLKLVQEYPVANFSSFSSRFRGKSGKSNFVPKRKDQIAAERRGQGRKSAGRRRKKKKLKKKKKKKNTLRGKRRKRKNKWPSAEMDFFEDEGGGEMYDVSEEDLFNLNNHGPFDFEEPTLEQFSQKVTTKPVPLITTTTTITTMRKTTTTTLATIPVQGRDSLMLRIINLEINSVLSPAPTPDS
jgi:hypothetical protein